MSFTEPGSDLKGDEVGFECDAAGASFPETAPEASFIIPARNEERMLPAVLESIRLYCPKAVDHEVIVVDHGSTDGTTSVASARGASVLVSKTGTIGHLRNLGTQRARGRFLVFLDADVTLTAEWSDSFAKVLRLLAADSGIITGSRCVPPESAGWIANAWFDEGSADRRPVTHIGTGHLVTTRALFDRLGGFDESLETGEDYDFSQRAMAIGAQVRPDPSLRAIHHGMPISIIEFVRREIWHGMGDWRSVRFALGSAVALASGGFVVLHATLAALLVHQGGRPAASSWLVVLVIAAICLISAKRRHPRSSLKTLTATAFLFYFYYWGRAVSPLRVALSRNVDRHGSRSGRGRLE